MSVARLAAIREQWEAVPDPLLIAVLGPTGAGKSALALAIAETIDGEIVNCDSLQIYRGFDIGAAKLPPAERRGIPHHWIDVASPTDWVSAGDYARGARATIMEVLKRERVPVVVGGTGFYMRALFEGLFQGPARDPALRRRLAHAEARRRGVLHRLLRRLDPASSARIHPRDVNKLIRAVEVCWLARRPMSELFRSGRDPLTGFRILKLGLDPPRLLLYERINRRTETMFQQGLVDEVRSLLAAGVPETARPLAAIGYLQALQYLRGETSLPEAIAAAQQATRRYAKRQWTWFRKEKDVIWLSGFGDDPEIQQKAISCVKAAMGAD